MMGFDFIYVVLRPEKCQKSFESQRLW